MVSFSVLGPPVPWHRAGHSNGRSFKVQEDVDFQKRVYESALGAISKNGWSRRGEYSVQAKFYVPTLHRRDIDNLAKNLLDGLKGVLYDDDTSVVDLHVSKMLDREDPRTEVLVSIVSGYLVEQETGDLFE